MSWKGRIPAGRVDDRPVSALDVFPTALAAAGVTLPAGAPSLDGVDLLPFLTEARRGRPHDRLYWRVGPKAALRLGDWKLVRDAGRRAQGEWQLFDLSSDQGERHDLAAREPAKLRELEAAWAALDAGMVEPLWGGGAARPRPAGRGDVDRDHQRLLPRRRADDLALPRLDAAGVGDGHRPDRLPWHAPLRASGRSRPGNE